MKARLKAASDEIVEATSLVGTEAEVAEYLQAALSGGNTLYMPQIPLNDNEARALASFIVTLSPISTAKAEALPAIAPVAQE